MVGGIGDVPADDADATRPAGRVAIARGIYVRALSATYASLFLVRVAFGVSLVTFPLYVRGSDTTFSLVATSSPLLELITIVFAGVLIDKYGRKGVLLTGLGLIVFLLVGAFVTFLSRGTSTLQLSGASTALAILGIGALLVAGQLFWGRLADRHGREVIMLVGAAGFTVLMGVVVYAFFQTPATLTLHGPAEFEVGNAVVGEGPARAPPGDEPAR